MPEQSIKKYLLLNFLSGALLNIPFFFNNQFFSFVSFFVISIFFVSLRRVKKNQRFYVSLAFFGAWLVPTSYWYFNFMPWWLASLALLFFVLIARVISLSRLFENKSVVFDFSFIIALWLSLLAFRLYLPLVRSFWIPNLSYTQWQNLGVLQSVHYLGVVGLVSLILFSNAFLAYLWIKQERLVVVSYSLVLIALMFFSSLYIQNISKSEKIPFSLVGIQSSPENGYLADANKNDVEKLKYMTEKAIEGLNVENVFVLWPENMIKEKHAEDLRGFAIENSIYLFYNRAENNGKEDPYNTLITISPRGKEILKNYKIHKAPGEKITTNKIKPEFLKLKNMRITTDICYDLHFSDISQRIKSADLLLASVDDDRFGKFMPKLHAMDIIFRAIENRTNIFTSGTSGPTMFVNKYGVVKKGPIDIYKEETLFIE